jgi:hypothetical protein
LEESRFSSLRILNFSYVLLFFMGCQCSYQESVMERCFHDFLLLCDEDDVEWLDGGQGAQWWKWVNTGQQRKLSKFVF